MGMSEGCTFRGRNAPFDLSTSAIEFSWNLKNLIRKLVLRQKMIFQAKNFFEWEKYFFIKNDFRINFSKLIENSIALV